MVQASAARHASDMPMLHRLVSHAACPGSLIKSRCKQGDLHISNVSQGLDYVVTQAAAHGMRLILTFTNYLAAYGGAQQYVNWYGGWHHHRLLAALRHQASLSLEVLVLRQLNLVQ